MGGGDLNMKKSWHPLLIKNQERVWKEEQKALEEQKKLTQLMKEKEEERQLQELRKLQESAGGKKGPERLDWMYAAGPNQSSSAKAQELEDFLLGKKSVNKLIDNSSALSKLSESNDVFTSTMNPNANSYRDTQAKIREDPLLLIKKTEQANIKAIVTNPIKLKELKEKSKKNSHHNHDKYSPPRKRDRRNSPMRRDYYERNDRRRNRFDDDNDSDSHHNHDKYSPPRKSDRRNSPMRRDYYERKQKLQQMMDDAKKLKDERMKRVDDINREEREEETKAAEHKKRTYESGVYSEYLKNAYKDAYSSNSSFDLGERVRRHRSTLQKAVE
ncbi:15307_t:CDS:2 [Dentiscutata heterogama]|uniref:15307_t:CDS:1 n=1 Tax=Dentiscutata heterogama TaxID=1316150 RepID=A0ACA9M0I2_9GLOM|nr:15307_t:CDS:2 [Dentiscutata heterogama]